MMNARNTALVFGLACIAGLPLLIRAQHAPFSGRTPLDANRSMGQAQTFRNLTLIPVYDSRATAGNDYMTLDEGLKSGMVTVKESANGGEVNTLYLTNKGKKPLYLMAGEVVLGGQQDRCIGADALVKAGTKQLPITVFCVEHNRWTGQTHFDSSAITLASADIRASAQEGAFISKAGTAAPTANVAAGNIAVESSRVADRSRALSATSGIAGRESAQNLNGSARARITQSSVAHVASLGEAQQQVWDKVAAKNRRFKTETESGTYRMMLNLSGGEAQRSLAPYIKALSAAPGNDPHLVGTVAAINGKVVAADIFSNSTLFRKLWPKLLRSYAADAAEHAQAGKKAQTVTAADAQRFLRQAADGKNRVAAGGVTGVNTRLDSTQTVLYQLSDDSRSSRDAKVLHENVLRK